MPCRGVRPCIWVEIAFAFRLVDEDNLYYWTGIEDRFGCVLLNGHQVFDPEVLRCIAT